MTRVAGAWEKSDDEWETYQRFLVVDGLSGGWRTAVAWVSQDDDGPGLNAAVCYWEDQWRHLDGECIDVDSAKRAVDLTLVEMGWTLT